MDQKTKHSLAVRFPIGRDIYKYLLFLYKKPFSRRYIKRLMKQQKEIFIEVGGGDRKGKNGWINIDITKNCDIYWDLSHGLPFPENSVKKVYCSHFLEHLSFQEGQIFFKSCLMALAPGGIFSACVPNAKLYIKAYADGALLDEKLFFGDSPAYSRTTKIDYVNYIAYMEGQHKYMFDEDNLIFILKAIGFTKVVSRKFDPNLDLKERDFESIYVKAIK